MGRQPCGSSLFNISGKARYHETIWRLNQGVTEQTIIKDLPLPLQTNLLLHQYRPLISKAAIFRSSEGMVNSIVRLLKLQVPWPMSFMKSVCAMYI